MSNPTLIRASVDGVTLLRDEGVPCGVTLAFTERGGGVSRNGYASLNLGDACGDDPLLVRENRRRALAAMGCGDLLDRLVNPRQVHGDHVVVVTSGDEASVTAARTEALAGADAVVCTALDVPVLLCYADCVPVIEVAPGGFAVVHSGWRGTMARISEKAARVLMGATGASPDELLAYVGPHVGVDDYEVSQELLDRFVAEFGDCVRGAGRHLDLSSAVRAALAGAGVAAEHVVGCDVSTARAGDRFYSYRASGGDCGRHGALACMRREDGLRLVDTFAKMPCQRS
jgi:YfiH family protein